MERYVAIDDVCAWPNLTLMPDGGPTVREAYGGTSQVDKVCVTPDSRTLAAQENAAGPSNTVVYGGP